MSEQSKPKATLDQAKAAWEAHPTPSIRKVMDALEASGLSITLSTMQRWKKSDWAMKGRTKRTRSKKVTQEAQAAVAEGIERQDARVLTHLERLEREETLTKARADELGKIDQDSELARQAMRTSLIAQIVLAEQITRRAAFLAEVAPDRVAKLLDALKGPAASTTIVLPSAQTPAMNGDDAKLVDGRVVQAPSETQLAIESFFERERQGVSA